MHWILVIFKQLGVPEFHFGNWKLVEWRHQNCFGLRPLPLVLGNVDLYLLSRLLQLKLRVKLPKATQVLDLDLTGTVQIASTPWPCSLLLALPAWSPLDSWLFLYRLLESLYLLS